MYTVNLSYHKQGDDFFSATTTANNNTITALKIQADMLKQDALTLDKIHNLISTLKEADRSKVVMSGDAHNITINGPKSFIDILLKGNLIRKT